MNCYPTSFVLCIYEHDYELDMNRVQYPLESRARHDDTMASILCRIWCGERGDTDSERKKPTVTGGRNNSSLTYRKYTDKTP